jgi:Conserved hypothetical protein 2217 (DUF2460)
MPATFPTLKTGAITQYPATKSTQYSSFVLRFLDGSDQRCRDYSAPLRRWVIQLDLLDEAELNALDQFFNTQQGRFGTFSFVDPWTQSTIPSCSVEQDSLDYELQGELRGSTSLVVVETRV